VAFTGSTETVTVVHPTGRDPFGDPLPGDPTEQDIPGCLFAPGVSGETVFEANTVHADAIVYAPDDDPAAAAVTAQDQIRARGDLYQVSGKPGLYPGFGIAIPLRLITG
jgi:hypothetical protein